MSQPPESAASMAPTSVGCVCATRVTWGAGASVAPALPGVLAGALTTPAAVPLTTQPSAVDEAPAPVGSASVTSETMQMR